MAPSLWLTVGGGEVGGVPGPPLASPPHASGSGHTEAAMVLWQLQEAATLSQSLNASLLTRLFNVRGAMKGSLLILGEQSLPSPRQLGSSGMKTRPPRGARAGPQT